MKQECHVTIITVFVPCADALIDMLRYDACFPHTEDDSNKIRRLMADTTDGDDHIIELKRASANSEPATVGRWQSFGCKVLDERHPDAEALSITTLRAYVLNYKSQVQYGREVRS